LSIDVTRAATQARGGQCVSTTDIDNNAKMSWMCDWGHFWQARFGQTRWEQWCPECDHMAQITNSNTNSKVRARLPSRREFGPSWHAQANDTQPQHRT